MFRYWEDFTALLAASLDRGGMPFPGARLPSGLQLEPTRALGPSGARQRASRVVVSVGFPLQLHRLVHQEKMTRY